MSAPTARRDDRPRDDRRRDDRRDDHRPDRSDTQIVGMGDHMPDFLTRARPEGRFGSEA